MPLSHREPLCLDNRGAPLGHHRGVVMIVLGAGAIQIRGRADETGDDRGGGQLIAGSRIGQYLGAHIQAPDVDVLVLRSNADQRVCGRQRVERAGSLVVLQQQFRLHE